MWLDLLQWFTEGRCLRTWWLCFLLTRRPVTRPGVTSWWLDPRSNTSVKLWPRTILTTSLSLPAPTPSLPSLSLKVTSHTLKLNCIILIYNLVWFLLLQTFSSRYLILSEACFLKEKVNINIRFFINKWILCLSEGVKKILASTNSTDLFSSCFELPSPSPYRSKPFELSSVNQKQEPKPPFERGKMFEEETKKEDHSVLLEPAVIPSQIKSKFDTVSSSKSKEQSPTPQSSLESETSTAKMEKLCCASKAGLRCCTVLKTKPRSLPSSPTFCRRNTVPMMSSEFFSRLSARKNQVLSKYSSDEDPLQRIVCDSLRKKPFYDHPLFKPPSANPPTREGKSSTSMQHPLRYVNALSMTIVFT